MLLERGELIVFNFFKSLVTCNEGHDDSGFLELSVRLSSALVYSERYMTFERVGLRILSPKTSICSAVSQILDLHFHKAFPSFQKEEFIVD